MSNITVIIPFINEGIEVDKTIQSIRETSAYNVPIIIINDGSTDGVDYKKVAQNYHAEYIEHAERKGTAASRDEGVANTKTCYYLTLDAHMTIFTKNWDTRLEEVLAAHPNALLCGNTHAIDPVTRLQKPNKARVYMARYSAPKKASR
ncbi:MAG: glycosyltransferase [Treponema sp.]|jgi:glycosyltransferase involved in cell wall biosynthesis|nr:glycosyltransferase [Treponema sp.]